MLDCRVNYKEGLMDCRLDADQLDVAAIPELVVRLGYQARLVSGEPQGK